MLTSDTKGLFPLKSGIAYLDHGGFGVTPTSVLNFKKQKLDEIEAAPRIFDADYPNKWAVMAATVAKRFSVRGEDLALVDNTTDGINAVLRSLSFQPGDEILITSLTYGAIRKAAHQLARRCGAVVMEAPLGFPNPDPEQHLEALQKAITPRTKIAILDHITSRTALVLPLAKMIKVCRNRGVAVLVDGAHAPGHIAPDIPSLGADWYIANLHKWCSVPRGCGFLWAAPHRQAGLLPNVLSWEIDKPFPACFGWIGTRDPSSWLSIQAAFDFMDQYGESEMRQHNRALVRQGMDFLCKEWGSVNQTPDGMIGNMGLVQLPEMASYSATEQGCAALQKHLWESFAIAAVTAFTHEDRIWTRVSAQIYNSMDDFEKLAQAVHAIQKR